MVTVPTTPSPAQQSQAAIEALKNGPAGMPPPGVTPAFVNPPNINSLVIMTMALCNALVAVAVIIRVYTKLFLIRSTAAEDYLTVLAWVGLIGFTVPTVFNFESGGGYHLWDIRVRDLINVSYWTNVQTILYGIIVCIIKLAILLQYLRIFVPHRKANMSLWITIQTLIWSNVLFYIIDTIFSIATCTPREKIWNFLITDGRCFSITAVTMASGVFNVVSDVAILILPMIPIYRLHMPPKKKIMMVAVFATGLFACITSVLRTIYTWKTIHSSDASFDIIIIGLWSWAEVTTGILIACVPVMPKFFMHFRCKVHKRFSRGSKSGTEKDRKSRAPAVQNQGSVPSDARPLCSREGSGHDGSNSWKDRKQARSTAAHVAFDELETASSQTAISPRRLSRVEQEV